MTCTLRVQGKFTRCGKGKTKQLRVKPGFKNSGKKVFDSLSGIGLSGIGFLYTPCGHATDILHVGSFYGFV